MLEITGEVLRDELLVVYFKFRKGVKVHTTKEIAPLVNVDYDKNGFIIGIEFVNPEDYGMSATMQHGLKFKGKKIHEQKT